MDFLVEFIIWCLGVYGTANIVVFSSIMKPVREFFKDTPFIGRMMICILCFGFWAAIFWSLFFWSPSHLFPITSGWSNRFTTTLFDGCIGSCVCWITYLMLHTRQEGK